MSEQILTEQSEGIKLFKNTRGYNWEIKLIKGKEESEEDFFARLKRFNEKLKGEYEDEKYTE